MLLTLKPLIIRPRVKVRAKKRDSGDCRDTSWDRDEVGSRERIKITPSVDPKTSKPHPIKQFLMDVFKIEEIDHEKFRRESKWAIRINKKD